jgi:predicted AlkP superfamily pyrophosphatase or phosphodiesterase
MQSTILTGLPPAKHGAVANGWYFRDLGEVFFWRQSARLVVGERVWEAARARDPAFTCANLFWWYAMHGTTDISVTPGRCISLTAARFPISGPHRQACVRL